MAYIEKIYGYVKFCLFKGEHKRIVDREILGVKFWRCAYCGLSNYRDR